MHVCERVCVPSPSLSPRSFLSVGVSVREGYWRVAVKGLEGACRQVGGANLTRMPQAKKTELRNTLKVRKYILQKH